MNTKDILRIPVDASPEQQETHALSHNTRDFKDPKGPNLLARVDDFYRWQQARTALGYWPYSRALESAPQNTAAIRDSRGLPQQGVNFASQDYLSLATDGEVKEAAVAAIRDYGVHSAGSAAVLGNTNLSLALERALGELLQTEHVTLYPTGWAAGFGVCRGLIRPDDYILIDALGHTCLQEGALASTRKISAFRHLDNAHVRTLLARIRKHDAVNGIMVVTESLFSMDSDTPQLSDLQDICHEYGATLMLDVAHDLGAMGPGGASAISIQHMLGKVDVVMGSFSKTFASNGGFVATRSAGIKQFLKIFSPSQTFSNALSPAQAATVLAATKIVRSPRGDTLRAQLMNNIRALRGHLNTHGLNVMGIASPIVPVLITAEGGEQQVEAHARRAAKLLPEQGVLANLAEFPAVPQGLPRFRMQVMAKHTEADTAKAARGVAAAMRTAARTTTETAITTAITAITASAS